jgi:hypothetical protein
MGGDDQNRPIRGALKWIWLDVRHRRLRLSKPENSGPEADTRDGWTFNWHQGILARPVHENSITVPNSEQSIMVLAIQIT